MPVIRVEPAQNHSANVLTGSAVDPSFSLTLPSDVEAEEIFCRCQVGSIHSVAEIVLPGAGLTRDREPSLERVLLHIFESRPSLGHASTHLAMAVRYLFLTGHSGPTPHFNPSWFCLYACCCPECCLSLDGTPLVTVRFSPSE